MLCREDGGRRQGSEILSERTRSSLGRIMIRLSELFAMNCLTAVFVCWRQG